MCHASLGSIWEHLELFFETPEGAQSGSFKWNQDSFKRNRDSFKWNSSSKVGMWVFEVNFEAKLDSQTNPKSLKKMPGGFSEETHGKVAKKCAIYDQI